MCASMCLCTVCVQCPWSPEEGIDPSALELLRVVSVMCMLGIQLGSWEEQPVRLTTESSLQPLR